MPLVADGRCQLCSPDNRDGVPVPTAVAEYARVNVCAGHQALIERMRREEVARMARGRGQQVAA